VKCPSGKVAVVNLTFFVKRGYTFINAQIDISHPHGILEEGDVHQSVSH